MFSYKICHLTSAHRYDDHRIYFKECFSLAQANYETHLVAQNALNEIKKGIHLHSVPSISNNRLLRMTKTVWNVYQNAVKVDAALYHFHDPELIPIGLLLKMRGKKVIYDVHEDLPRTIVNKNHIPRNLRKIISVASKLLENFASKYFDAIVTATPPIAERFTKLGCLAIDIKNYPDLTDLEFPNLNWEQKEQAVCYLGSIGEQRGIFETIAAIEQTNANLLLAGNFAYPDDLDKAMIMPGWDKVRYLGYLNRQEVAQVLAKSMAGLVVLHPLVNYLDALPVKMFEYMFAGIPIVASDFPLWKQIIEEHQCGICVNPLDPNAIAAAIQWIIDNPEPARQMGENGRRAIEEKYNWDYESTKLLELYNKLLY
jgi:glycosyltransferase involved in cell wall biosynthesis